MSDRGHVHGERGEAFELIMPFVVVVSDGGPYDDLAYAAGWEAGQFDVFLAQIPVVLDSFTIRFPQAFRAQNVAQLGLIAMRHGLVLSWELTGESDEWVWVTVSKEAA